MPDPDPCLVCHHLQKHYFSGNNKITILQDVNLSLAEGQSVALMGTSGVGKSTLLAIAAGLDTADQGKVLLLGQDVGNLNEDQRAALRCGQVAFVFQSFELMEGFTALQNVLLPLQIAQHCGKRSISREQMWQKARQVLHQVGLQHRENHLAGQLSGGEKQRVALARAFVIEPKILFADEPTGNLDQYTGEKIAGLMFSLQQKYRTALVLVTHDQPLAQRCDRVFVLKQGSLHERA